MAASNEAAYHEADIALHRAIAVASQNPLVVLILDSLTELLMEFRVTATRHRRARGRSLDVVVEEHRRIVEFIEASDAEGAANAMRTHIESARRDALDG